MYFYKLICKYVFNKYNWVVHYEHTNRLAGIHTDLLSGRPNVRGGDGCFAIGHRAYRGHQWYFFELAKTQAGRDVAGALYTGIGCLASAI